MSQDSAAETDNRAVFELPEIEAGRVFVVDDDPQVLRSVERLLDMSGHAVCAFDSPTGALAEIRKLPPQVLVVDLEMPEMTGIELATKALEIDPNVRVIMVTGAGDESAAQASLRLGFSDYVRKPIDPRELGQSVQRSLMELVRAEYERDMGEWLQQEVQRQTDRVQEVTLSTMESLLQALEARSPHFRGHSQTVAVASAGIARELGLAEADVRSIRTAGLLHDVGMIAVPDLVVNKPGELDLSEYELVREHCTKGAEILEPMAHLGPAGTFVLEHHERWDGSGYPDRKRGEEISLGGQIVGLAEVWVALTERRAYRDSLSNADAMQTLEAAAGCWFTSELIEALRASEM